MGDKLFGENGLVGSGLVSRIGRFSVQTPVGTWSALGTQPYYKAPGDSLVEIVKTQWLILG